MVQIHVYAHLRLFDCELSKQLVIYLKEGKSQETSAHVDCSLENESIRLKILLCIAEVVLGFQSICVSEVQVNASQNKGVDFL